MRQFYQNISRSIEIQQKKLTYLFKTQANFCQISGLTTFILTVFFSINTYGQIRHPQTPQFPNSPQQPSRPNYPMGGHANDIINQTNRRAMEAMGYTPPPTQDDIRRSQQLQTQGKPPELSPQMKLEKEMVELLRESQYHGVLTSKKEYYNSPYYLNDLPNYLRAKEIIRKMLRDTLAVSIRDAYYFSEAAYGNLHLTYNEYTALIETNANFIRQWLNENRYSQTDPEALHLGIQKFMSDTLYIVTNGKRQGHIPYYYDYIDATSETDRRNYFVTKTLATGSGQCHTFPATYLILAEALGVEANLAYNPMHSFIRYSNNAGMVVNYETTVDRFLPDAFYLETLPVMAEAYRNELYVTNLNKKQIVASVLLDLAVNFIEEHWLSDKSFVKECMSIAEPFFQIKTSSILHTTI